MNCLHHKIPWNKSFFNLNDNYLDRHVDAASRKSLEIQGTLSQNQEPFWSENVCEN